MTALKSLVIRRSGWDERPENPLEGNVVFRGVSTETKIILNESLSRRIVEICADELKKAAHSISQEMMAEIITDVPSKKIAEES